ncbi:hypothetical protein [Mesorhizobium sp. M0011]|uniref:hypothetical protein n=1 Tax=Mesorhizobium sp. M0011 TaxID=2956839 RepID=UPI0033359F72
MWLLLPGELELLPTLDGASEAKMQLMLILAGRKASEHSTAKGAGKFALTEDGKAPDESEGTFIVIPASTGVRHTVVGTQIRAYNELAELNSAGG